MNIEEIYNNPPKEITLGVTNFLLVSVGYVPEPYIGTVVYKEEDGDLRSICVVRPAETLPDGLLWCLPKMTTC